MPISSGELLDKITILRIKAQRMSDPAKLANVRARLAALEATWGRSAYAKIDIHAEIDALLGVNQRLWVVDDIRDKERAQTFDAQFVSLARAVYIENDEHAAISGASTSAWARRSSRKNPTATTSSPEALPQRFRRGRRSPLNSARSA